MLFPLLGLNAQTYKFRQYGIEDGICHPFVYTVNQDKLGYIWLGTGEGLCRYDGFSFTGDIITDSMPTAFIKKSFKDSNGDLWFGHNDGSISWYDGGSFRIVTLEDRITSTINDITTDDQGNIIFLTQNRGMIVVDKDKQPKVIDSPFRGMLLSSFELTEGGNMLIGGYDGLHLFESQISQDTLFPLLKVEEIPYTRVTAIQRSTLGDTYWIGTEDEGIYRLTFSDQSEETYEVRKFETETQLKYTTILSIYPDQEGILWLSTQGEGVYKMRLSDDSEEIAELVNYNEENGLGSEYIREVFEDLEGNLWISTYGNGLASLFDEAFTFYNYDESIGSDVYSVSSGPDALWLGGNASILRVDDGPDRSQQLYTRSQGLPDDRIQSLFTDSKGSLWIGTRSSGLYRMNAGSRSINRYHFSENSLENTINRITEAEGILWVATNNGVVSIDLETGARSQMGTVDGLPHNSISDIFVDSKENVWMATRSNGLHSVNTDLQYRISGNFILQFVSITEDDYGILWAATSNNGVFRFLEDSVQTFSTHNGLKSGACYSIEKDLNGNIWVGHRLGLSQIDVDKGIVITYGTDEGIEGDCRSNSVAVSADGDVMFGTSSGLVNFDTESAELNLTPPLLNITSIRIEDVEYPVGQPIVLPYGKYKLRVEFIGLNFKSPETVNYQYRLDGYDDWSDPVTIQYAQYGRVEDGNYTFMVRACNSEGICSDQPVGFSLQVKLPIWKTWWFISLSVLMLIFAVFFIIKYRERKAKQFQEMLQTKLDERTREVVQQKEEIEVKNKDITDSINYAQRIQASILPPMSKLHDTFSGSFVYYQPRDIVSGDFYWYDMYSDDKFVIVCADSTGHGVPGAFMSMIGTTIIKELVTRMEVESPAHLLKMLDREIMASLNQNIEAEQSNDGMDMIVSEINLTNNHVKISSAMRPMIIYQNGEQIYVRGSRNAVGGQFEGEEKDFETNEFQLSKGDKLYMFSDGYPDQFGGPLGKKFKMVRLKNMLRDIHEKPMEEQYTYIKNNFELWKEEHEQVDDVLFMGIEI